MNGQNRADPVHALAEVTMIEAFRLLLRMPDREKGYLKSGTRSSMPEPLPDLWLGSIPADLALELGLAMADDAPEPKVQLSQRDVAKVERAWLVDLHLAEAVPAPHKRLFITVLAAKAGRMPGGFKWEDIGERLYGRNWGTARCDATTDALRMRYEACLRCIAVRMAMWAIGEGEVG